MRTSPKIHAGKIRGSLLTLAALLALPSTWAATKVWTNAGGGDFNTAGNWTGGVPLAADTGFFNIAIAGPITLSSNATPGSLTFDTNVSSLTLGTVGGNTITGATAGQIAIAATLSGTGKTISLNAPIILGSGAGAVAYGFNNNAVSPTNTLVFGGQISGGTSGTSTLTLGGTNTGANAVNGNIVNGAGTLAVSKTGVGSWTMAGTNSYTGTTGVSAGTLNLTGALTGGTAITVNGGTLAQSSTGSISGAASSLTVSSGAAILSAANTHTGTNTISGGQLFVNHAQALGTGALLITGGTVANTSGSAKTLTNANPITLGAVTLGTNTNVGGTGDINFGTGAVSYSGVFAMTLLGTGATYQLDGAATNTGASSSIFTVNGAGNTLVFGSSIAVAPVAGNTNFIGNGNITILGAVTNGSLSFTGAGTLTLAGANTYTSSTVLGSGSVVLDYSSNAGTKISGSGTGGNLTLGGSVAVSLNAGAVTETVGNLTFNAGANSINRTGGSTGKIVAGTIATRNAGSTLALGAGGILSTTTGVANSLLTTSFGVLGVVGGDDWAAKDASNLNVVAFDTVNNYVNSTGSTVAAGGQTDVVTNVTLGAAGTTSTLRFNTGTAFTIDATGQSLTLTQGGVLVTPAVANNLTLITGGTLKAGSNNAVMIFQNNTSNGLTIASTITDGSGASTFTKSGAGLLTLTGTANTYTGKTYLNQGTLNIAADGSLGTAPGAVVADQLTMTGGTLQFGANNITLSANRGITLINGGNTIDTNGNNGTVSGIIAGGGNLTKTGTGTLFLTAANTFTAPIMIKGGVVNATTLANANTASSIGRGGVSNYAGDLVLDGGLLQYTGVAAGSSNRNYTLGTNGGGFDASGTGAGTMTLSGNMTASGTSGSQALSLTGSGTGVLNGLIVNGNGSNVTSVVKSGNGTWTMGGVNTYSGATTISAGTLILSAAGSFDNSSGVNLGTAGSQGTLDLTAKSSFTFGTGQTVSGFGSINIGSGKTVTVNGNLAPGNSTGVVNITGNLTLGSTANTTMELVDFAQAAGTGFDQVNLGLGTMAYNGVLTIDITGSTTLGAYNLFDFGAQSGTFTAINFVDAGAAGTFDYTTGILTLTAVPEPGTWLLLSGAGTLFMVMRRRRQS